jgi:hypothetical protein
MNYKEKFFTKNDPSKDVPGYYKMVNPLCTPFNYNIQSKDKTQIVLKNEFNPLDYTLNYKNDMNPEQNIGFYYNNKDIGPGRGFGNLNTSYEIRNGNSSRNNTKEYRDTQEKQQLFDYQIQYLNKNFQDPKHIVMEIPRGGEQTRKQNQLKVGSTINFNY